MANLGDLIIKVGGDPDGFKAAMAEASDSAGSFTQKVTSSVGTAVVQFNAFAQAVEASSEKTGRAAASTERALRGVADGAVATALAVKTYTVAMATSIQHAEAAAASGGNLANTWRALRLAISPTAFTATGIAVGVLVEELVHLTNARAKLIEQQSLFAAVSGQQVGRVEGLDSVAGVGGSSVGGIRSLSQISGLDADGLGKIAEAFNSIEDPAKRAAEAVRIFGAANAGIALNELTPEFANAANAANQYGVVLDSVSRTQIYQFRKEFTDLRVAFQDWSSVKTWWESFKTGAEIVAAAAEDMARRGMKALGAMISAYVPGMQALRGALHGIQTPELPPSLDPRKQGIANGLLADDLFAQAQAASARRAQTLAGQEAAQAEAQMRANEAFAKLAADQKRRQENPNGQGLLSGDERFSLAIQQQSATQTAAAIGVVVEAIKAATAAKEEAAARWKAAVASEERDTKAGYDAMYADLEAADALSTQEKIAFRENELREIMQSGHRDLTLQRDIQRELGHLYQQSFTELAAARDKDEKDQKRYLEEMAKEREKWALEAAREAKKRNEGAAKEIVITVPMQKRLAGPLGDVLALNRAGLETVEIIQSQIEHERDLLALASRYNVPLGEQRALRERILHAEIDLGQAQGHNMSAQRAQLTVSRQLQAMAQQDTAQVKIQIGLWNTFNGVFGKLSQGIASAIVNFKSFGSTMTSVVKSIAQEMIQLLVGTAFAKLQAIIAPTIARWLHLKTTSSAIAAANIADTGAIVAARIKGDVAIAASNKAMSAGIIAAATATAIALKAIASALDVAQVVGSAAVAGAEYAATWAWAGPDVSIPMGLIEEAEVLTTFVPTAAFEKGGLVPETMMALVHKGEWVTPAAQVAQGISGPRGGSGGSSPISIVFNGVTSARDISREVMKVIKQVGGPRFSPATS